MYYSSARPARPTPSRRSKLRNEPPRCWRNMAAWRCFRCGSMTPCSPPNKPGRPTRHIGDFRAWKDHDAYQRTLERLLRDLRVEAT
jgi:hypothetical protein